MPAETLNTTTPPETELVSEDQELEMSITGVGLVNDIDRFLRRYLECSDHQRAMDLGTRACHARERCRNRQ